LLALLLLGGCTEPPAGDGTSVVAEEARYRVLATTKPTGAGRGALELRVEMRGGWHIAEEAPVGLDLGAGGIAIRPAQLRVEHAHLLGEDEIEWRCDLVGEATDGATATAQLKLGICEGPGDQCVIVKREFEIPIALGRN
jgi:hypothetical protein